MFGVSGSLTLSGSNVDGTYALSAVAFEATFSQRNIFRGNRADFCNYGFWLGYSSHTQVDGNSIRQNRAAGVAIEHGHHNIIEGNAFERNADGAQFWVTANPPFTDFFPECSVSADNIIRRNTFSHNDCGVRIWTETGAANPHSCARFTIEENSFADNRAAFFAIRADAMEAFEVRDREELETGPFGVWVPRADDARHIAARDVSVVLTPGLAFGRADGSRLGRGAGFYDRFFARADVMARRIGVCLGSQLRERVPAEPHDAPMHGIVTEERFLPVHAS